MTAADLLKRFHHARQRMNLHAQHPDEQAKVCRYCGKAWVKYAGTALDGHGGCYVTEQFRAELASFVADRKQGTAQAASLLGVSAAVVRMWVSGHEKAAALMRRIRDGEAQLPHRYPDAT